MAVVAIVACIWAVGMLAGFIAAGAVVAGVAIVCAALSLARRRRARAPHEGSVR